MKANRENAILEIIADQFKCIPSNIQPETSFEELLADSLELLRKVLLHHGIRWDGICSMSKDSRGDWRFCVFIMPRQAKLEALC
jgi:hypothetical protein